LSSSFAISSLEKFKKNKFFNKGADHVNLNQHPCKLKFVKKKIIVEICEKKLHLKWCCVECFFNTIGAKKVKKIEI